MRRWSACCRRRRGPMRDGRRQCRRGQARRRSAQRAAAGGDGGADAPLGLSWPREVFSLSHVALPFPLQDGLYGADAATRRTISACGSARWRCAGERGRAGGRPRLAERASPRTPSSPTCSAASSEALPAAALTPGDQSAWARGGMPGAITRGRARWPDFAAPHLRHLRGARHAAMHRSHRCDASLDTMMQHTAACRRRRACALRCSRRCWPPATAARPPAPPEIRPVRVDDGRDAHGRRRGLADRHGRRPRPR